ncbi:BrnA antitoxin family protein [Phenylobacterium sp.]|uniref:BrnA antitoxin family protein n=1 Tax=Phenylobacterium sp. TaxID=1871053 RepID=UPI00286BE621|nr:BrnA antitoxin family protein [Phenylobacterium sp.]
MNTPDPFKMDDENPELTAEDFARMKPAREVLGDAWVDAQKRARGRPRLEEPKEKVTLRLDADILRFFRASGGGWQTRLNDALRGVVSENPR